MSWTSSSSATSAAASGRSKLTSTATGPPAAAARSAISFPSIPPPKPIATPSSGPKPPSCKTLVTNIISNHEHDDAIDSNLVFTFSFYIDDTPIRVVRRSVDMGGDYPSKPMSLYATIWDGSNWATSGGKYKVNYKYSPFVAEFSDLVLQGCKLDPIQQIPTAGSCAEEELKLVARDFAALSPERVAAMRNFRTKFMTYSFCYDSLRYPSTFPDCEVVASEQDRFKESGHLKFGGGRRRHRRVNRRSTVFSSASGASE